MRSRASIVQNSCIMILLLMAQISIQDVFLIWFWFLGYCNIFTIYSRTIFFYSKQRCTYQWRFDRTDNFWFHNLFLFCLIFHSFKNVEIVCAILKAFLSNLYKNGKLNLIVIWEGFLIILIMLNGILVIP